MSFIQKTIVAFASVIALVQCSNLVPGACPVYESNLKSSSVNMTDFGGLWYEYAYSAQYAEGSDRECSTWNLLSHANNETGEAFVYDLLHHSVNQTANTTKFVRQAMVCGE